jgi:Asp-tRNA(Asn)/Glu-tRNA(Gln) amidotransferase C subunit
MFARRFRPLGTTASATIRSASRCPTTSRARKMVETDECGIPLQPTWSVDELLTSYPRPTLSSDALTRLHTLSALIPPEENTLEHSEMKSEMEDLIKLVEAVKLVDTEGMDEDGVVPDGRVWADGTGIPLSGAETVEEDCVDGSSLLCHAARTSNGLYVVEADRTR